MPHHHHHLAHLVYIHPVPPQTLSPAGLWLVQFQVNYKFLVLCSIDVDILIDSEEDFNKTLMTPLPAEQTESPVDTNEYASATSFIQNSISTMGKPMRFIISWKSKFGHLCILVCPFYWITEQCFALGCLHSAERRASNKNLQNDESNTVYSDIKTYVLSSIIFLWRNVQYSSANGATVDHDCIWCVQRCSWLFSSCFNMCKSVEESPFVQTEKAHLYSVVVGHPGWIMTVIFYPQIWTTKSSCIVLSHTVRRTAFIFLYPLVPIVVNGQRIVIFVGQSSCSTRVHNYMPIQRQVGTRWCAGPLNKTGSSKVSVQSKTSWIEL